MPDDNTICVFIVRMQEILQNNSYINVLGASLESTKNKKETTFLKTKKATLKINISIFQ